MVPLPSKVSSGNQFSGEELDFLNLPNTTRDDVLASLGQPLIDLHDPGVLLYVWWKTSRTLFVPPGKVGDVDLGTHASVEHSDQEWGLFIAYDQGGHIVAHQVRKLDTGESEKACVEWRLSKTKS